jgi:hypothetical protein
MPAAGQREDGGQINAFVVGRQFAEAARDEGEADEKAISEGKIEGRVHDGYSVTLANQAASAR